MTRSKEKGRTRALIGVLTVLIVATFAGSAAAVEASYSVTVSGGYKYTLANNKRTYSEAVSYNSGQGSPYYFLLQDRLSGVLRGPWYKSGLGSTHFFYEESGIAGFQSLIDNVDPDGGSGGYTVGLYCNGAC